MKRVICLTLLCYCLLFAVSAAWSSDLNVMGELYYSHTLQPGGVAEGDIDIQNTADETRQVRIYQTDYRFSADGTNDFGSPGSMSRSNASWIMFSPQEAEVPPGATVTVHYRINVPQNPSLKGTYWSLLMVETVEPAMLDPDRRKLKDGDIKVELKTLFRFAVQMVTNIGDAGEATVRIADKRLVRDGERRILQLDVENTGEVALSPSVWAQPFDEDGTRVGKFDGDSSMIIYPGCCGRFSIDLSGLERHQYKTLVVIDGGNDNVFGAQYALDLR